MPHYSDTEVASGKNTRNIPLQAHGLLADLREARAQLARVRQQLATIERDAKSYSTIADEWKEAQDWPAYYQTHYVAEAYAIAAQRIVMALEMDERG